MMLLALTTLLLISHHLVTGAPKNHSTSQLGRIWLTNLPSNLPPELHQMLVSNSGGPSPMPSEHIFPDPVATSLHEFAFDVYRRISPDLEADENLVFSPISLYSVLFLLLPGLDGRSLKQVSSALRTNDNLEVAQEKESTMCGSIFANSLHYTLNQTNRIYIDQHFQLLKAFKSDVGSYHRAPVKKLDFSKPRQSRSRINRYVASATKDEIQELIPEGGITSLTKMVLINTVYMEAQWASPFTKGETRMQNFHVPNSEEPLRVLTMESNNARCSVQFSPELNSRVVMLPFTGQRLSMVFFIPQTVGDFTAFTSPGSTKKIQNALSQMWLRGRPLMSSCSVRLPKFSIEYDVSDAKKLFKSMGMTDIFSQMEADFTRMTSTPNLYVSDVRHKATIKVNEDGVKAAAASSIGVSYRMLPMSVDINKPFLFMIRHEDTGAVLFIGKVVRPQFRA